LELADSINVAQEAIGKGSITRDPVDISLVRRALDGAVSRECFKAQNPPLNTNMSKYIYRVESEDGEPIGHCIRAACGYVFPQHFLLDENMVTRSALKIIPPSGQAMIVDCSQPRTLSNVQYQGVFDALVAVDCVLTFGKQITEKQVAVLENVTNGHVLGVERVSSAAIKPHENIISYDASTSNGDCGLPVIVNGKIVGLHCFGSVGVDNAGIAITTEMLSFFRRPSNTPVQDTGNLLQESSTARAQKKAKGKPSVRFSKHSEVAQATSSTN